MLAKQRHSDIMCAVILSRLRTRQVVGLCAIKKTAALFMYKLCLSTYSIKSSQISFYSTFKLIDKKQGGAALDAGLDQHQDTHRLRAA